MPPTTSRSDAKPKLRPIGLLVLLLMTAVVTSSAYSAPAGPNAFQQTRPGRVIIQNLGWDSIRVEVRVGRFADCERNALVGMHVLKRRRAWGISSDTPVCWRRERSMGHFSGMWMPWTRRAVTPDQLIRVTL